jgi:hypothetical protein
MENVMSALMLNTIGWLIGWKTLFSVSAFYMQRLHHENPNMRGSSIPGPMLMSTAANVMSWCTLALTVYVWYRLGWMPALAFFVFPFILAMIVENIELFVFRFPTNVMSLVGIPVAIISFVALIVSVLTL